MANNDFIDISQKMLDVGKEEVFQEIDQELRPSADDVKLAAKQLTDYAYSLQLKYGGSIGDQLASLNMNNEQTMLNFSKKYVQQASEYSNLMKEVFNFQNKVNEFLGQKIIMTFVAITPTTGKVTLYNMENSVADLSIGKSASSRGGYISGRISSLQKIKNAMTSKQIIDSSQEAIQSKESLDMTFQEVWQRYRISKAKLKLGGAAYIMWNIDGWDGRWISGAGPLGEAYVAFFINRYIFSKEIEHSVKDYITNENYGAQTADNASGFLKGDIVKGAAQFGVKVRGAQPLSYMDIINYAQEIQQVSDIEQYLQTLSQKLDKEKSNNMVKELSEVLGKEYEQILDDIQDRINHIGTTFKSDGSIYISKLTASKK